MSDFGLHDPRDMPAHLFWQALRVDYDTAVRANPEKQNCSICPRYWFVDAVFSCERCGNEFTFTAAEQRLWYEEYRFWVDSIPKHCLECRRELRQAKTARQEYDRWIEHALDADDYELKQRLARSIDLLYELGGELPARINEKRRRLARQIGKAQGAAPANGPKPSDSKIARAWKKV